MSAKVIIAGIVAGIVLFGWGFLTHVVVPLGEVGISVVPNNNEEQVSSALKQYITEPGLYFVPGMDKSKTGEELTAEMDRWTRAYEAGPTAFLAYHPTGKAPMGTQELGLQALFDVLVGISAAFIVSFFRHTNFLCKVMLVGSIGLIAFLETDAPYYNWYRFPLNYTGMQLIDKLGGMVLVGFVLAAMIRNSKTEVSK